MTFAYLLQGADAKRLTTENLLSVAPSNPLVCITRISSGRCRFRHRGIKASDHPVEPALRCRASRIKPALSPIGRCRFVSRILFDRPK